ncbi:thiamine-phosphate diphosphorylase [Gammaproteobacteria bacterium 42_54_T18]|nr:thiamine-phosphate diphosphorylase [Gammaproteobacteria bacterium 42_54_T18]
MRLQGLYAITDNLLTPAPYLIERAEQALLGGVRILQYRDKTTDKQKRLDEALALKALCTQYQCTFIINDDIELCMEVKADGVHLGVTDANIHTARQQLGNNVIIGATCHGSLDLAHKAVVDGADYVAFGRFYSSTTKPNAEAADLQSIRNGLANLNVPAVAIGGITLSKADELLESGFSMLAVIEDIFKPASITSNITSRCSAYCDAFARH